MSVQTVDYALNLDTSGFAAGSAVALTHVDALQARLGQLPKTMNLVQRGFAAITPSRTTMMGLGGATAAAAQQQQRLSGLAATQKVLATRTGEVTKVQQAWSKATGANNAQMRETVAVMGHLARTYPIGNAAAEQTIIQLNRMGITGEGSQKKIAGLATVFTELGGATGESAVAVGQGVTQLARAMGDNKLDPTRIRKLSDAVVTASAASGSGASDILSFSKAIAPLAKQAGIGETGVLGISSAFAKIGEDGFGAATAVNKVMSDLNASVRDGSSQMDTYAEIVGKTRKEFEALYKASPIEALTQVTEAVAKEGSGGQRVLERLGLDGVRTQRALQALSASGGLREAVQTAGQAYGSGSTQRGAEASFGGVLDSFTKIEAAGEQLATALGQPLLQPLGAFVALLGKPIKAGASVAENPVVQRGIQAAGVIGALALVRRLGSGLALGRLAVSNDVLNAARVGRAVGRSGGFEEARGTRAVRMAPNLFGRQQMYAAGEASPATRYGRFTTSVFNASSRYGADREAARVARDAARTEPARSVVRGAARVGVAGVQGVNRLNNSLLATASRSEGNRMGLLNPRSAPGLPARGLADNLFRPGGMVREADGLSAKFKAVGSSVGKFDRDLESTSGRLGTFRRSLSAASAPTVAAGRAVGSVGLAAGRSIGSAAMGLLGGPMLAILAGTAVFSAYRGNQAAKKEEQERLKNLSISGTLDDYRQAMGLATDSTRTLADQVSATGKSLMVAASSFQDAATVTGADRSYAEQSRSSQVRDYGKNTDAGDVASRISSLGITNPQELAGVKIDLLRQYSTTKTSDILSQVAPGNVNATGVGQINQASIDREVQGIADTNGKNGSVWQTFKNGILMRGNAAPQSKPGQGATDDLAGQIGTQYKQQSDLFGSDYATNNRYKNVQAAFEAALKTKDAKTVQHVGDMLSTSLAGHTIDFSENSAIDDFTRLGKPVDFAQLIAGNDKGFASTYNNDLQTGLTGDQTLDPTYQKGIEATKIAGIGGSASDKLVASFFDNSSAENRGRDVNQLTSTVTTGDKVGDLRAQQSAVDAMVNSAKKAGVGLADLAVSSTKAAYATTESSTQRGVNLLTAQEAQRQLGANPAGLSSMGQLSQNMSITNGIATMDPTDMDPAAKQAIDQAKQTQIDQANQVRQAMQQRLQVVRDEQKAESRAYADNALQVKQINEDFNTQMSRNQKAYDLQLQRTNRNNDLQVQRSKDDFQLQEERGTDDFNRGRIRAQRDFNKQMARMAEDGAKAMYDPYKRIQVQQIWDGQSLIQNLKEQTDSIQRQTDNLAKARSSGLSDQAINILGLNQAQNAQQLQTILDNQAQDPSVLQGLNDQVAKRQAAGGTLATDAANTDQQRARDDFNQQLADQESDFQLSMGRARTDFAKQLDRARHDFDTSLADMAQDQKTAVANANADHDKQMARSATAFKLSMTRMAQDVADSQKEIFGTFQTLQQATTDAMNGKSVDFNKITTDSLKENLKAIGDQVPAYAKSGDALAAALVNGTGLPAASGNTGGGNMNSPRFTGGPNDSDAPAYDEHGHPISSGAGFGRRIDPFTGKAAFHTGVDTPMALGTPVGATRGGQVKVAKHQGSYGNLVSIDHGDGTESRYGHLSAIDVVPGAVLKSGEQLGKAGSTGRSIGSHLHYEELRNGKAVNPGVTGGRAMGGGLVDLGADPNSNFDEIKDFVKNYVEAGLGSALGTGTGNEIVAFAMQQLDKYPYSWGGGGPNGPSMGFGTGAGVNGFDCSGFTEYIYSHFGFHPGGDSRAQKAWAKPSGDQPGALAFFGNPVHHVGISRGDGTMVNAAHTGTRIRVDKLFKDGNGFGIPSQGFGAPANQDAKNAENVNDNGGGNRGLGKQIAAAMGLSGQWNSIDFIATKESGWNNLAQNPHSTAFGIPQFLDATWKAYGGKTTDPATQIKDMLRYENDRYGGPAKAEAFWRAHNWYGDGGVFSSATSLGHGMGVGERGPEAVIPLHAGGIDVLAQAFHKYMTADQAKGLSAAASRTSVSYHGDTTIDQGFHIDGPVTVQASDPDEMERKLSAKKRTQNLVGAPRGRR